MKFDYYASLANEITSINRQKIQLTACQPENISSFGYDSAMRIILEKILPADIEVSRGWIINADDCGTYSDIIVFDKSSPVLFRDGNEVILMPAASSAMIRIVREIEDGDQLAKIWNEWIKYLPGEVEFHGLLVCQSGIDDFGVIEELFEASPIPLNQMGRGIFMLGQEDIFSFWVEDADTDTEEASIQLEHIQIWLPDCENPALSYVVFELLNSLDISHLYPEFDQLAPDDAEDVAVFEDILSEESGEVMKASKEVSGLEKMALSDDNKQEQNAEDLEAKSENLLPLPDEAVKNTLASEIREERFEFSSEEENDTPSVVYKQPEVIEEAESVELDINPNDDSDESEEASEEEEKGLFTKEINEENKDISEIESRTENLEEESGTDEKEQLAESEQDVSEIEADAETVEMESGKVAEIAVEDKGEEESENETDEAVVSEEAEIEEEIEAHEEERSTSEKDEVEPLAESENADEKQLEEPALESKVEDEPKEEDNSEKEQVEEKRNWAFEMHTALEKPEEEVKSDEDEPQVVNEPIILPAGKEHLSEGSEIQEVETLLENQSESQDEEDAKNVQVDSDDEQVGEFQIVNKLDEIAAAVADNLEESEERPPEVDDDSESSSDKKEEKDQKYTQEENKEFSIEEVFSESVSSSGANSNVDTNGSEKSSPEPIIIPRKSKKDPIYIPVKKRNPISHLNKFRRKSTSEPSKNDPNQEPSVSGVSGMSVKDFNQRVEYKSSPVQQGASAKVHKMPSSQEAAVDQESNSPLHLAVLSGETEVVRSLLEAGEDTELKNKPGNTPLHIAADHNQINIVRLLLEFGADINSRNYVYSSPLHLAVAKDHNEIVSLLIENGAEIEVRNNRGYTPMHKASEWGSVRSAEVLISYYADIHTRMERDLQPLHLAAWYGQSQMVQLLIDHGAELNAVNSDGNTALHFAAFNGQVKVIKVLINNNANPNIRNLEGETYLQGINKGYQGEMRKVLE